MRLSRTLVAAGLGLGLCLVAAVPAEAQRYPFGPFGPYGRYPIGIRSPGFYGFGYDEMSSSLRLEVTPRDAEIYVDGYRAGIADEFDGVFQRLRLRPGEHEVVFYMDGFKRETRKLYLNPATDQRIKFQMVALGAGQSPDPRPIPTERPVQERPAQERGRGGRVIADPAPPAGTPSPVEPSRFGTLSIRVVPANAEIIVDGQRWRNTNALVPLVLQLSVGRHLVEIRRPGYESYASDVDVKVGETSTLNVSLRRR